MLFFVISAQKVAKDQSSQFISSNFYQPVHSKNFNSQTSQTPIEKVQLSKQAAYSSALHFSELSHGGYHIQPPSYNMIYPSTQQFIYPSNYQQPNFPQSLYQPPDDLTSPQVNVNQIPPNQSIIQPQPTYVYQDNPACYFYPTPQWQEIHLISFFYKTSMFVCCYLYYCYERLCGKLFASKDDIMHIYSMILYITLSLTRGWSCISQSRVTIIFACYFVCYNLYQSILCSTAWQVFDGINRSQPSKQIHAQSQQ